MVIAPIRSGYYYPAHNPEPTTVSPSKSTPFAREELPGTVEPRLKAAILLGGGLFLIAKSTQEIYEKVEAGNMVKKGKKTRQSLARQLELSLPEGKQGARYEVEVIDLISGKRVHLAGSLSGNMT